MDYLSLKSLLRRHWVISNLYPTPYPIFNPRTSRIPPQSSTLALATDDGGQWCLVPFSQLERENNYMISIMQSTMLDFAVVTPFCTCFSSEISWGTVALFTHLLLDAARITASRSTKRTEIDSKDSARNARRKGRALGHVPAVKGGASWYPRAPTGSPPRRDRDRQILRPRLRIEAGLDRPSTRLGERSSKTRCLVCRSIGKCSNLLSPAFKTAFRPFCPDRHLRAV